MTITTVSRDAFNTIFRRVEEITKNDEMPEYEQQFLKDAVDELRKRVDYIDVKDLENIRVAVMGAYYIGIKNGKKD